MSWLNIYYKDGTKSIVEVKSDNIKKITISRKRTIVDVIKQRIVDAEKRLINQLDAELKKPRFDFRGLWYTSQGLFVEILGTEGFILDEKGNRLQTVCVDQNGFLSPTGGRLEIAKRNYIRSEDIKVVQRGKIDKEWPPCQTQF